MSSQAASSLSASPVGRKPRDPPGRTGIAALRTLRRFAANPTEVMSELADEFGDIARLSFAGRNIIVLRRPEYVEHVLRERPKNYTKNTIGFRKLRLALGQGLVTSQGELWRRQRRTINPTFHRTRIEGFAEVMTHATSEMLAQWDQRVGTEVDVADEMMRLTMRIAGQTFLGVDVTGGLAAELGEAIGFLSHYVNSKATSLVSTPWWLPTPHNMKYWRMRKAVDQYVTRTLATRRADPTEHHDFLAMLMGARDDETNRGMSDQLLRDEIITMFSAGHETTANALNWTCYLLAKNPQATRKVLAEIKDVLGDRIPEPADIEKLSYTTQVLKESMRLYPPVWLVERNAEEEDDMDGYRIPKGAMVVSSQFMVHRHPDVWDNPEAFDPDRFTPEREAQRHKFAYFPFLGGPRQCIGMHFAMMEAVIVLAMVLRRYELELPPGYEAKLDTAVTLRPKDGLPMRLVRR